MNSMLDTNIILIGPLAAGKTIAEIGCDPDYAQWLRNEGKICVSRSATIDFNF